MLVRAGKRPFLIILAFLICPLIVQAQMINEIQFVDKPLREVLTALGQMGGKTVLVDDTVNGNATHYIKSKTG